MNTSLASLENPASASPRPKRAKKTPRATTAAVDGLSNTLAERDRLVSEHLHMVDSAAGRMKRSYGRHVELDELISFGQKGLLDAARRYNAAKGTPFTVFAFYRIRGAMLDGMRSSGLYSRYDIARYNTVLKLRADQRVNELLEEKMRIEGASAEEAAGVAATLESIADTLSQIATVQITSIEALQAARERHEGDGDILGRPTCRRLFQGLDDKAAVPPDELFERASERHALRQRFERALAALPAQERRLIELHYFDDQDLKDIRGMLGMSKWNLSRLHSRAIRMLRDALGDEAQLSF